MVRCYHEADESCGVDSCYCSLPFTALSTLVALHPFLDFLPTPPSPPLPLPRPRPLLRIQSLLASDPIWAIILTSILTIHSCRDSPLVNSCSASALLKQGNPTAAGPPTSHLQLPQSNRSLLDFRPSTEDGSCQVELSNGYMQTSPI